MEKQEYRKLFKECSKYLNAIGCNFRSLYNLNGLDYDQEYNKKSAGYPLHQFYLIMNFGSIKKDIDSYTKWIESREKSLNRTISDFKFKKDEDGTTVYLIDGDEFVRYDDYESKKNYLNYLKKLKELGE